MPEDGSVIFLILIMESAKCWVQGLGCMFQSEVCSVHFQCVVSFAVYRVQRVFYYPHLGSAMWRQSSHIPLERL